VLSTRRHRTSWWFRLLLVGSAAGIGTGCTSHQPLVVGDGQESRIEPIEVTRDANQQGARQWGGVGTALSVLVSPTQAPVTATIAGIVADGSTQPTIMMSLPALLHVRPDVLSHRELTLLIHHPHQRG
jgi:hypothetical protein